MYKIFLSIVAFVLILSGLATALTGLVGYITAVASPAAATPEGPAELHHFGTLIAIGLLFIPVGHAAAVIAREQDDPYPSYR